MSEPVLLSVEEHIVRELHKMAEDAVEQKVVFCEDMEVMREEVRKSQREALIKIRAILSSYIF